MLTEEAVQKILKKMAIEVAKDLGYPRPQQWHELYHSRGGADDYLYVWKVEGIWRLDVKNRGCSAGITFEHSGEGCVLGELFSHGELGAEILRKIYLLKNGLISKYDQTIPEREDPPW